jgi:cytochrome b pre-mRNA-processing protein 3
MVRRLGADGGEGRARAQVLFDLMFADMDANLRELGVGDLSVGKYVKRLARNFHSRLATLDTALDGDQPDLLRRMLRTNVYHGGPAPTAAQLEALESHVTTLDGCLASHPTADLAAGRLRLPRLEDLSLTG